MQERKRQRIDLILQRCSGSVVLPQDRCDAAAGNRWNMIDTRDSESRKVTRSRRSRTLATSRGFRFNKLAGVFTAVSYRKVLGRVFDKARSLSSRRNCDSVTRNGSSAYLELCTNVDLTRPFSAPF